MSGRSTGLFEGASAALVGAGTVTVALFPLAVPFILLTAVALIPFVVVVLTLSVVAAPLLLVTRWLRRTAGGRASGALESKAAGPTTLSLERRAGPGTANHPAKPR